MQTDHSHPSLAGLWDEVGWEAPRTGMAFGPERPLWANGVDVVIGVDEAGRGPLAGPVVAGAAAFAPKVVLPGIGDSKQLSERNRDLLEDEIKRLAQAWAVAEADPATIDRVNILQATRLAMIDAVRQVMAKLDADQAVLLVDGRIPAFGFAHQINLVKGDARSFSIGAASVLAKVHRDRIMVAMDALHPGYGFARHKGYPTVEHRAALRRLGCSPIHRREFTLADERGMRVRIGDLTAREEAE